MSTFFLFLFLFSAGMLLVGVINPRLIFKKDNEKIAKIGYRKYASIVFSFLSVVFLILMIAFGGGSKEQQKSQAYKAPYTYKTQEGTLARQIEQKVIGLLGEKNNLDKPRIIGIDVEKYNAVELRDFGYKPNDEVIGITVKINASENLTANLQKQTTHKEAFDVFKNVFPLSSTIGDIVVWSYLPVKDKFGNVKDEIAITYVMSRSLFVKVNWGGLNYSELPNLLQSETKNNQLNSYRELIRF